MTATEKMPPAAADEQPARTRVVAFRGPLAPVVDLLASMRLTVVLLAVLALLTWLGTLAQVELGLYESVKRYFEGWWLLHPCTVFGVHLQVPLPGAYPVMLLLFVNLLVGGFVRLKWSRRNVGVLIVHFGIALLLVAGFVKLHWSTTGMLALYEHHQDAVLVSYHEHELVLVRRDAQGRTFERRLPEAAVAGGAKIAAVEGVPFAIDVHHWFPNCRPMPKGPMFDAPTPVVEGAFLKPMPMRSEHESNAPGCYVTVTENGTGARHEGILWASEMRPYDERRFPFTFQAGGATWGLDLRRVVEDLPFAIRLEKFQKTDHPGTMNARDFRSKVTVLEGGSAREVEIFMNAPLRKAGYVFFQSNWGPQPDSGENGPPWYSVFEVANNPSDAWPKYASYVILAGLLVHFLGKLSRFLRSSLRRSLA